MTTPAARQARPARSDRALVASVLLLLARLVLAPPLAAQRDGAADARGTAADALPLATPRPLRFSTDEGTWISVDVSPDGRTLVFDLLGDLYTLPVGGGTARRITSGQAFDAMPRFSPDGARLAFVSDRSGASNLWVANADGTGARPLSRTDGYQNDYVSPTWTPDGRNVLVAHNNGPAPPPPFIRLPSPYDLYHFALDGGGTGLRLTGGPAPAVPTPARPLTPPPAPTSYLGPAFAAPDLVWYSTSGAGAQLYTLDLRTGQTVRRTMGRAGAVRPVLSPDGRWLVYATRRHDATALRLRDLATGDERWLVPEAQRDQMAARATRDLMPGMAFTPDGRALVTSYGGKLWRVEVPSGRATPIPFTADVDQAMGASTQFEFPLDDSTLAVRQIRVPRLSPDGRRVAFVALDRVWVADLPPAGTPSGATVEARGVRRLTTLPVSEYAPAWSPDGRWVAFSTWDDSTGGDVFRVRVGGAGGNDARVRHAERLTTVRAYYEKLAYTPDGARLLFARTSRADRFETEELGFADPSAVHADLMAMPAAGGPARLVTRLEYLARLAPPYYGAPHFGPNFSADTGRVLVYDPGANGLYAMRLDGTDRRLVVRATQRPWNASGEEPADDIVLSPTGGYAAILGAHQAWLAAVPAGGAAPTLSLAGPASAAGGPTPLRRLTRVGANFVGWSPDGRTLHYALGASLFLYDVAAADSAARAGGPYAPTRVDVRLAVPKDRPAGTLVLRGARVVTMRGDEVIEDGEVVVRGNRIAAVGPRGSAAVPPGARVVDVSGKTILPGYVDTHAHTYALGWGLHHTEPWQYYAALAYGVTTTRDPQTGTTDVLDYADRVETGDVLGPRVFSTGPGVFVNETPATLDDARDLLRRNSDYYHTETIKAYALGDRRRRQLVARAAGELRLSPTNEGDADFTAALTHMLDGYAGEEHTLPVFPLYRDVVQLAAQSGIAYTPVLLIAYGGPGAQEYFTSRFDLRGQPKLRRFWPEAYLDLRANTAQWRPDSLYVFPRMAADAARIAAAGGRVAVGAHGNLHGIGYHFELWALGMGGMPPHAVLRAATLAGAQAIGHARDLGSLEPGKLADLQVLDGNPLADLRATNTVRLVVKNGRLYDANTLDELWPRARPLPTGQWWAAAERR